MMRDMHDGGPLPVKLVKNGEDTHARILIEHGGRLVEYHHTRIHRDNPRDGDALLLPAAHGCRIVSKMPCHAYRIERIRDLLTDARTTHAKIFRAKCHIITGDRRDDLILRILEYRTDIMPGTSILVGVRPRFVEHHVSVQRDDTRIRGGKPGNQSAER